MRLIEIITLENGAHRNLSPNYEIPIPDGWAVIPDDMVCENFPFGEITVDESEPPVVTSWTPGEMPEPEPMPEPNPELSVWDELDAAYREGVNAV